MSRYAHIKRSCPGGMASAMELAAIRKDEARLIRGFLPGRYGALYSSHLMRWANGNNPTLWPQGMFWHLDPRQPPPSERSQGVRNRNRLVTVEASALQVWTVRWRGAHDVPSLAPVTRLAFTPNLFQDWDHASLGASMPFTHIVSVQVGDETFFCAWPGSRVRRFIVDADGQPHVYECGMDAPTDSSWSVAQSDWTGAEANGDTGLTPALTYDYRVCWADERQRLSSPSATESLTVTAQTRTADEVDSSLVRVVWPEDEQVRYAVIFRAAQGTTNYYAITPYGADSIYVSRVGSETEGEAEDRTSEADLVLGDLAPQPGENDQPPYASCLAWHGGRLWCDDRSYGAMLDNEAQYTDTESLRRVRCSNLNAPTQWNSVADVEDEALGVSLTVGADIGDRVAAIAGLGTALGVWRERSFYYITGTSAADWTVEHAADVGCVHQTAMTFVRGTPYWLAEDGVYTFSAPFVPVNVALRVNNYFGGAQKGQTGSIEAGG